MFRLEKVKSFAKVSAGQGAPQSENDFTNEGFPFIRAGHLEELLQGKDELSLPKVNSEVAAKHRLKLFPHNTIVFAKSGMSAIKGRVYMLKNSCYVVNHLAILELNEKAYPDYILYALRKFSPVKLINDPSYPSINQGAIENHIIPLPPLPDQIRIATILSQAEALINQRKESIRLLDELLKSTFLEMFGDPTTNPKKFPIRTLSEFYINPQEGTKCGPFGSALKKEEYISSGIPVWVMDNITKNGVFKEEGCLWITEEKFKELERYGAQRGDVIISRAGTVGKMCVLYTHHEKSIISTNLIRVRFGNDLMPLFFVSLMNYCKGRVGRLKTGAEGTFTHMNTGILDSLQIPYPPLPLQTHFASIVEKAEAQKLLYQQSLSELENLYASLSRQAFRGELSARTAEIQPHEQETLAMAAESRALYGENL